MKYSKRKWHYAGKVKSVEEIYQRHKVYINAKKSYSSTTIFWFCCNRRRRHHCPFGIRWDELSGKLWESGKHNHEPTDHKYRDREWKFVTKVSCYKQIRRQFAMQKSGANIPACIMFRCNFRRKQQKCHYAMRWNSETGELFESGQHSDHPISRIKIFYKWHLLETKRQNSAAEIRRRYAVKDAGHGHNNSYARYWFKCGLCDGQKCDFRLRWDKNSTEIFWNNEQQCQRQKNNRNDAYESEIDAEAEEGSMELEEGWHICQKQLVAQNQSVTKLPSEPVVFLEEIRRADYKCRPPLMMKREAIIAEKMQPTGNPSLLPLTIDEEEPQSPMSHSHWCPNLVVRRVKKEEESTAETQIQQHIVVDNGNGGIGVDEQAPTRMLLRERKRPPNYYAGLDGNGEKEMRRVRAKK